MTIEFFFPDAHPHGTQGGHANDEAASALEFTALRPGRCYGTHELALTPELVEAWCKLYGAPLPTRDVPAGFLSVISIRAFMATMPVRPPGGIHAAQRFTIHALPRVGERVLTSVHCGAKEARNGRLWVDLEMKCRGAADRTLFEGVHKALWAR
ncbi:hypothetical protein [Cupriavidus sp. 8B]